MRPRTVGSSVKETMAPWRATAKTSVMVRPPPVRTTQRGVQASCRSRSTRPFRAVPRDSGAICRESGRGRTASGELLGGNGSREKAAWGETDVVKDIRHPLDSAGVLNLSDD